MKEASLKVSEESLRARQEPPPATAAEASAEEGGGGDGSSGVGAGGGGGFNPSPYHHISSDARLFLRPPRAVPQTTADIPDFYSSTPTSSDTIKLPVMQPPSALPYAPLASRRMVSFCAILS